MYLTLSLFIYLMLRLFLYLTLRLFCDANLFSAASLFASKASVDNCSDCKFSACGFASTWYKIDEGWNALLSAPDTGGDLPPWNGPLPFPPWIVVRRRQRHLPEPERRKPFWVIQRFRNINATGCDINATGCALFSVWNSGNIFASSYHTFGCIDPELPSMTRRCCVVFNVTGITV